MLRINHEIYKTPCLFLFPVLFVNVLFDLRDCEEVDLRQSCALFNRRDPHYQVNVSTARVCRITTSGLRDLRAYFEPIASLHPGTSSKPNV